MRLRNTTKMLALLTVTIGASLFLTKSADAAAVCPAGAICFYKDIGERGTASIQSRLVSAPYYISDFRNSHFNDGEILNDQVSSIVNNSSYLTLMISTDTYQHGLRLRIAPGTKLDLTGAYSAYNDAISSADTVYCVYDYSTYYPYYVANCGPEPV